MKKFLSILLVLAMMLSLTAMAEETKVMTYAEFTELAVDSPVTVETYVQAAAYNATYGNVCLFLANEEGAYYVYRAACDDALAAQLTIGAKVLVNGYKSEWAGEVEIADATLTVEEGSYIAEAIDVTEELAAETLIEKMNQLVSVKKATVVAYNDKGDAFSYNWDGSGQAGANNDLYFNVTVGEQTYSMTVESDECAEGTDVYTAVTALKVGDVIDLAGFLYWYNGANIHVVSVAAAE